MQDKILILSPFFFGYTRSITDEFSARGYEVWQEDERLSNSTLVKLIFRIAPHWIKRLIGEAHITQKLDEAISKNVTHVLLFSVEIVSPKQVQKLRKNGITVSRYSWDSVSNRPGIEALDQHVNQVGSFDPVDVKARGYKYIPLFSELALPEDINSNRPIDFSYCGSFHSTRPYWFGKIKKTVLMKNWSSNFMLYYQTRWAWWLQMAFKPQHWHKINWFKTTPFSKESAIKSMRTAKVVIDIHHPKQAGLTMRTFEALANGAVLLTTNPHAKANLPPDVLNRVAILNKDDIIGSMETALSTSPPSLSEISQYYLSIHRFVDQLEGLLGLNTDADQPLSLSQSQSQSA